MNFDAGSARWTSGDHIGGQRPAFMYQLKLNFRFTFCCFLPSV